jgi:hypothetical protein
MKKMVVSALLQMLILWTLVLTVSGFLYLFAVVFTLPNDLDLYISLVLGAVVYIGCQKIYLANFTSQNRFNKILMTTSILFVTAIYLFSIYLRLLNMEF